MGQKVYTFCFNFLPRGVHLLPHKFITYNLKNPHHSIAGLRELNSSLWHVEESCSVTGEGLDTGLDHLCHLINRRKKIAKRKRNKTKREVPGAKENILIQLLIISNSDKSKLMFCDRITYHYIFIYI